MLLQLIIAILVLLIALKFNTHVTSKVELTSIDKIMRFISGSIVVSCLVVMSLLVIRRLHDANFSGTMIKVAFVSIIIFKSDDFVNNYGPKPQIKDVVMKIFSIIMLAIIQHLY